MGKTWYRKPHRVWGVRVRAVFAGVSGVHIALKRWIPR